MRAVGAVTIFVADPQFLEESVQLLMVRAESAIAREPQAALRAEHAAFLTHQALNLIALEILARAEYVRRVELTRPPHHHGRIPRRRPAEHLRMPQQQSPRAPSRLAEAEQQPRLPLRDDGIGPVDERNDHVEQIRLLSDCRLARMIGIPGYMGEGRRHEDRAVAIVGILLLHLAQPIPIMTAVARLDRQHIHDRIRSLRLRPFGQQHPDAGGSGLIRRADIVDPEAILIPAGSGDGHARRLRQCLP